MSAPDIDVQDVTDPDDPRLDDFRDLNSVDRRPDLPTGKGLVIAEGVLVVQRMLASRFTPRALLGTDRRLAELRDDLAGAVAPYYRTSAEVMAQAVGFHLNRGVLASASRVAEPSVAEVVGGARTVAVLEGVNDHENLGSIFRNAAGLGVDAVVFVDALRGHIGRPQQPVPHAGHQADDSDCGRRSHQDPLLLLPLGL
ncbi:TrmH family RNA methyltransferase, partial [Mycobacterium gordonae]|uniref:TrmH family RNA methyltransferase n=1 Tax=Mycobacterium gordonae TaxID=1778 RepID=UPI0039E01F1B